MGNSSSCDQNALEVFYQKVSKKYPAEKAEWGATGGGSVGGMKGGYSSLETYGNSIYSAAKENLIRGIAKDVSSILKVDSSFADKAELSEVVDKLSKLVPNPKKKKSIINDSDAHKELCVKLAKAINKRYDMQIIDLDAPHNVICTKVAEILYSLFAGLHTEFLTVSGDVTRVIKNLQILQEYVDSANKKLMDSLSKYDEEASPETDAVKDLYHALTKEIGRQQAILANLVSSSIGPVGESLITLLESNDDFKGLTSSFDKKVGTPEFGLGLSALLNGTANTARAAQIVDKSLKTIGMSVKEYKAANNIAELRNKVYKNIVSKKPNSDELYKLLAAADAIYQYDAAHDDIVSYLEGKKGGIMGGAIMGDSLADDAALASNESLDGTTYGRSFTGQKRISKQIEQKRVLRKQLFATLNNQIKEHYKKLQYSLSVLGKKIGNDVELTPELTTFVNQLSRFAESQPDRKNLHIALSGYRTDPSSEYVKYQFMENLYAISESADPLAKQKYGTSFRDVKNIVDSIIQLIIEFNATFTKSLTSVGITTIRSNIRT